MLPITPRRYKRYGVPGNGSAWGKFHDRFDVAKEPNEANRFGWIVEFDPFDPNSMPKKRTALGRFKHEGAAGIVNKDGRYVVYTGDDERFDYVYRFVTTSRIDPTNPRANRDLPDAGTLSVARSMQTVQSRDCHSCTGKVHSLPPTVSTAGRYSDRNAPRRRSSRRDEDGPAGRRRSQSTHPEVYVVLTNNDRRTAAQVDPANPRAKNNFGHLIEMTPPDGDHAAEKYAWGVLVRCGDPKVAEVGAMFSAETTQNGWFGMPDNVAFDAQGRLWVAKTPRPVASTASGASKPKARCAARRNISIACRSAPRCAAPSSRLTTRPCLSRSSIRRSDEGDPNAPAATFENPATR